MLRLKGVWRPSVDAIGFIRDVEFGAQPHTRNELNWIRLLCKDVVEYPYVPSLTARLLL